MKQSKKLMKTIAIMFVLAFVGTGGRGQSVPEPAVIEPHRLAVTCLKTTTLSFPFAIRSVDRGSRDVLAHKAEGMENVLWVKAARKEMEQTNLTVITTDGKLYSYLVEYVQNPAVLTLHYPQPEAVPQAAALPQAAPNGALLKALAEKVACGRSVPGGGKVKNAGMSLVLEGMYVNGNALFCRMSLRNKTHIDYEFDSFRFAIRDRRQPRRTASQERGIRPLLVHRDTVVVKGRSAQTMVFVLPKFTIPERKYLAVEVMEKNGGRHLTLRIKGRSLIRTSPVAL